MRFRSLILFFAIGFARPANADSTHHAAPPIGDRAIGLAGAFTAVADDGSATFYNPAGLVFQGSNGFTGGLTLLKSDDFRVRDAFVASSGTAKLSHDRLALLPTFGATVSGFRPTENGHRFAVAYSVFQLRNQRSFDILLQDGITDWVRVESSNNAYFHGISAAFLLHPRWSIGASLYLRVNSFRHTETEILSEGGTPVDPSTDVFTGADVFSRQSRLSGRLYQLAPRLGVMYRARRNLTYGAMLQIPATSLHTRGRLREQIASASQAGADAGTSRFRFVDDGAAVVRGLTPLELHVGAARYTRQGLMLTGDVALIFPVPGGTQVAYQEPPDNDDLPAAGVFFPNTTRRRPTVNLAGGLEWEATSFLTLRGGVFTDFSTAPHIPAAPSRYQPEHIHRFGAAGSVGLHFGDMVFNIGAQVRYGTGSAVGVIGDLDQAAIDFASREARERTYLFTISGATHAARSLARMAMGVPDDS